MLETSELVQVVLHPLQLVYDYYGTDLGEDFHRWVEQLGQLAEDWPHLSQELKEKRGQQITDDIHILLIRLADRIMKRQIKYRETVQTQAEARQYLRQERTVDNP
jgi:hypothetical protein